MPIRPDPKDKEARKECFMSNSHSKSTCASLALHLLHLLRDLHIDFKELGHAAVDADGFSLVEVTFQVGRGNALLHASVGKTKIERNQIVSW